MCKSKRIIAVLLGLVMTMSLSGCAASASLVTDTGSGKQEEIPIEDYLKTDVLEREEQTVESLYTVLTLTKGNFVDEALKQILSQDYINVPTIRFELEGIAAQFGEYRVQSFQYVDKGDVIATAYTEVDELALEEARVKLQRLEERYKTAETEMTEDLKAIDDEKFVTHNKHKWKILDIRATQRKQDWEYQKANFESQIKEAKEELQKLTQVGSVYEVKADSSGYVVYSRRYHAGTDLKEGDYICHIMNSNVIYATTDEQATDFYYGKQVIFDNLNGLTPGTVVNGGNWALYGNLDSDRVIFRLDFEQDISELNQTGLSNLILKGNLKEVNNVILIPKKAVTVEEDQYFVTVLEEEGTLLKTEFIPGGSNVESYWVLEGLTEGMQIVY